MVNSGTFDTMNTESVKIEKDIVDKVRKLKEKDRSINIGGFIGQATLEKIKSAKSKKWQYNGVWTKYTQSREDDGWDVYVGLLGFS